ncbi:MAG: 1-acyl-sn-glycerol-3-phosphate acyltransferase [Deltaproteobacteria bacterium]|nr:1-acyl-sn-glycerol-3-phosphate acyltransferase [Deltaproteobacteria bacterium]
MLLRTVIFWILVIPLVIALFVLVSISLIYDRSRNSIHSIGASWFKLVLWLAGIKVETRGFENLRSNEAFVIMSNHQGVFDIPVIQAYLPLKFRWVAKKSLFKVPVLGWAMRLAGYISIDRAHSGSAYRSMEQAGRLVSNGTSVLIFPEGTRGKTGGLLDFKRGGFHLMKNLNARILPISITGTRDIINGIIIHPSRVMLTVGEPISGQGLSENDIMDKTRLAIEAGIKEGA